MQLAFKKNLEEVEIKSAKLHVFSTLQRASHLPQNPTTWLCGLWLNTCELNSSFTLVCPK